MDAGSPSTTTHSEQRCVCLSHDDKDLRRQPGTEEAVNGDALTGMHEEHEKEIENMRDQEENSARQACIRDHPHHTDQ